jgi:GAF domain-containing protein
MTDRIAATAELLDGDLQLATALCSATSLAEVGTVARAAARQRLRCAGVTFVLYDGGQCFYADEDSIAPLWAGQRFPVSECVSGWAMVHNEPAVIDDIEQDDRVPIEAYRSTYVKSMVVVPIAGPNGPAAAIGAYWPASYQASRADLAWLQRLATATSGAIEDIGLGNAPWAPNFRTRFPAGAR